MSRSSMVRPVPSAMTSAAPTGDSPGQAHESPRTKISPATQRTEAQAKADITTLLNQQAHDKALNTFSTAFQKKWKAKTDCRFSA